MISKSHLSIFFVCFVALLFKSPDAFLNPQFWAEDGPIFYAQQVGKSGPQIAIPYAGYLHFLPRLMAWILSPLPVSLLPLLYNLSALIIDTLCVALSVQMLARLYGKVPALIAFFLLPNIGDIFGTLTNVQWFMQFFLILIVLNPGTTEHNHQTKQSILTPIVILVAALTGPFSIIDATSLLILQLIRTASNQLRRGDTSYYWLGSWSDMIVKNINPRNQYALCVGAGLQIYTVLTNKAHTPDHLYAMPPQELSAHGYPNYFSVYSYAVNHPNTLPHAFLMLIFIVGATACLFFLIRHKTYPLCLTVYLLAIGATQPFLAFIKQNALHTINPISHYYYFFGVVCFCAISLIIDQAFAKRRVYARATAIVVLAAFLFAKPIYLYRSPLPSLNWPDYARKIEDRTADIIVPLNPGWRLVVPALKADRPPSQ